MPEQLDLFADTATTAPEPGALVCAFGVPWEAHGDGSSCDACDAETARQREAFRRSVEDGVHSTRGYTPAESRGVQERSWTVPAVGCADRV